MRRRTPLRQIEIPVQVHGILGERVCANIPAPTWATPPPSRTSYVWGNSHAKWNLLRKIEHGNTTTTPKVAADLRPEHKIAIWWQGPGPANSRWYTSRVLTAEVKGGVLQHTMLYDSDKSRRWTHILMPQSRQPATGDFSRWVPAPPTFTPPCPGCGGSTRGGTGASTGRLSYTCDQCSSKCTSRDPATLARADPANPRITEDPDIRPTQTRTARRLCIRGRLEPLGQLRLNYRVAKLSRRCPVSARCPRTAENPPALRPPNGHHRLRLCDRAAR